MIHALILIMNSLSEGGFLFFTSTFCKNYFSCFLSYAKSNASSQQKISALYFSIYAIKFCSDSTSFRAEINFLKILAEIPRNYVSVLLNALGKRLKPKLF